MVYFFRRGPDSLTCETRLKADGPGFELVIKENDRAHIEHFSELPRLLSREHELLQAWRAQGWRDVGVSAPTRSGRWTGPR